jgi:fucose 4-O-acetylase-like acetyltransferase
MTAFIFFSGYFYKKSCNLWETVKHVMRNVLFPYVIFVAGVIVINYNNLNIAYIKEVFIKYLIGMSFSKKVFSEVSSVGPVYFILMLFIIRLTYLVVDYVIKNERYKWLVIACISIFGMVLGEKGFWLPWSIDIACYAMVFYQLVLPCVNFDEFSTHSLRQCRVVVSQRCHRIVSFLRLALTQISGTDIHRYFRKAVLV